MPVRPSQPCADDTELLIQGLGRRYWLVLICVAAIVVLDQAVVQPLLSRLDGYAPVINVAGRQRMLSQRIAKTALALSTPAGGPDQDWRRAELRAAVAEWAGAQQGLQHGSLGLRLPGTHSPAILAAFQRIAPHFEAMQSAAEAIGHTPSGDQSAGSTALILAHEAPYLEGMHHIVGLFEQEAQNHVRWLQGLRLVLGSGVILLLAALGRSLLAPAVATIRGQVQQLAQSETRHRLLIERMHDGLAIFDRGGRISYVNDRLTRMLARPREALIGLPLPALAQGPDRERLLQHLEQCTSAPATPVEINWYRPGGESLFTLTAASHYLTGGAESGSPRHEVFFAVMTDITPQQQATFELQRARDELEVRVQERTAELEASHAALSSEMAERRSAEDRSRQLHAQLAHTQRLTSIGQLATGLAHELNQPLGAVVNYAEAAAVLLEQPDRSRTAAIAALRKISAAALRAGQIVRRIRNFVRPQPPLRTSVSLGQLIRDVVDICEPDARRHRVKIICRLDDSTDDRLQVDPIQIQQVLVNLMQNAQQAMMSTESATRTLTIATATRDEHWEVQVEDTGPGLTPAVAAALFQPFVTTKSDGLGMGLTISRSIMESHAGRLFAENTGAGARFTMQLPRTSSDVPGPRFTADDLRRR